MFRLNKIGKSEFFLIVVFLLISSAFIMACASCEDFSPSGPIIDQGIEEADSGDIEFDTRVDSPYLTVPAIAVMIFLFIAVIYGIIRTSGQKKNLTRQQKRAQTKQNEKKQSKKSMNKNKNNKKNTGINKNDQSNKDKKK